MKTLSKRIRIKQRNRKIEKALLFFHFHSIRLVSGPSGLMGDQFIDPRTMYLTFEIVENLRQTVMIY